MSRGTSREPDPNNPCDDQPDSARHGERVTLHRAGVERLEDPCHEAGEATDGGNDDSVDDESISECQELRAEPCGHADDLQDEPADQIEAVAA